MFYQNDRSVFGMAKVEFTSQVLLVFSREAISRDSGEVDGKVASSCGSGPWEEYEAAASLTVAAGLPVESAPVASILVVAMSGYST